MLALGPPHCKGTPRDRFGQSVDIEVLGKEFKGFAQNNTRADSPSGTRFLNVILSGDSVPITMRLGRWNASYKCSLSKMTWALDLPQTIVIRE